LFAFLTAAKDEDGEGWSFSTRTTDECVTLYYFNDSASKERYIAATNYNVTFYHLDVTINIPSPFITGSTLCQFKIEENFTEKIVLNLFHSLRVDSITGNSSNFIQIQDSIHSLQYPMVF
jgi:hypothetical protein